LLAVGAATGCLLPLVRSARSAARPHAAAAAVLLTLLAWTLAGAAASLLATALGDDHGMMTALGTLLLCLAAAAVVGILRARRLAAARWVVYPLLLSIGGKLLLVDVPHGRPLTLFVALAALGAAVLITARSHGRWPPAEVASDHPPTRR